MYLQLILLVFVYLGLLISHSLFKTSYIGHRILSWQCFSFSVLNISCHCLLTSTVSDDKSAIDSSICIEPPSLVHMELFFSCCFQGFLFVFIWQLNMMCIGVDFFQFILLGICLALWISNVFHQIWVVFSYYFFQYFFPAFFFSFRGTYYTYAGMFNGLHRSLVISSFCFFFLFLFCFSLCSSDWIIFIDWPIFRFTDSCTIPAIGPISWIVISVVLCNSRISIWFVCYNFYLFIDILCHHTFL